MKETPYLPDFTKVSELLQGFYLSTGLAVSILDLEGNVLALSDWQKICKNFHRVNPDSCKRCLESDTILASKIKDGEKYHLYKCLNGLVDVVVPIEINDIHIANLYSGQFLFEEPDRDFFIKQAETFGFEKKKYLQALDQVPIVSKEKAKDAMTFLSNLILQTSEMTMQIIEHEKQHDRNIDLLSKTAMQFVEFPQNRNIYDFIGEQISEFVGKDAYIVVNSVDQNTGISTIQSIPGMEKIAGKITKFLGRHPIGMQFDLEDDKVHYQDGKVHVYDEGLYGILLKALPKTVCKSFEKLANIKKIFICDLAKKEHFLGSVIIFQKANVRELKNQQLIETFIKQASIAVLKRQAEEALKESEEKYRLMAENSSECLWSMDNQLHFTYLSPAIEQMTGFKPEEWEGTFLGSHFTKKEVDRVAAIAKEHIKNCKISKHRSFESKMITKTNEELNVEISSTALLNQNGDFIGMQGITRDITQRKQAEEKLQFQADFIDNLIENSALSTWISDTEGIAVRANPACLDFFGATKEEVIGKYNLFKDEVLINQGLRPKLNKVYEKGEVIDIIIDYNFDEVEHVSAKNATHKIIKSVFTPIFDKNNKLINVICQSIDLTEIKKAEEALKESEGKFRSIFENKGTATGLFGEDGIIQDCNNKFVEMSGFKKTEIIGKMKWSDYVVKEDLERMQKYNSKRLNQGEPPPTQYECGITSRNNQIVHVIVNISTMGSLRIASLIDISERKKAENELAEHREKLENLVEERTKELQKKNKELERFNKLFVGREFRIKELRDKITAMEKGK